MGLFDSIKDALTTDDQERLEAAQKQLQKAEAEAAKARAKTDADAAKEKEAADKAVAEAKAKVDELANKAGVGKKEEPKAAPAPQAAPAQPQFETYTVKKGDNLSKVGQKYGVSWREIAELNNIKNPDLIHPGQEFKIPKK